MMIVRKNQTMRNLVSAFLLYLGVGTCGQAASFDCSKASTKTEEVICEDIDLSALDDMLTIVWERYKNELDRTFPLNDGSYTGHPLILPEFALEKQRNWLSETRACNGERRCISDSYENRILSISNSNFTAKGAQGKGFFRRYFKKSTTACEPSSLSVDAYYDESVHLCYELIPSIRSVDIFAASGVVTIKYYELAPGYYDCSSVELYVIDLKSEGNSKENWILKYSYSDGNDVANGLRHESEGSESINLAINLNDGFRLDNYNVGCGMYNSDVFGGAGFGGVN